MMISDGVRRTRSHGRHDKKIKTKQVRDGERFDEFYGWDAKLRYEENKSFHYHRLGKQQQADVASVFLSRQNY